MFEEANLEEFEPDTGNFTLAINKKTYHLRKFSLSDEIWLKKKYGNDSDIRLIIRNSDKDFTKIAEIAYHQIKEEQKSDFLKQTVTFVDEEGNSAKIEVGGAALLFQMIAGELEKRDILYAVVQTFGVSRNAIEKEEENQKKKDGPTQRTDWARVFDLLASEYGWTLEYILTLSVREVSVLLNASNIRNHNELKNLAAIQGVEIKDLKGVAPKEDEEMKLSPEQQAALDESLEKAKLRKIKEMRRG